MPDSAPISDRRNSLRLDEALGKLKTLLGDRLSTAQAVRDQHAQGEDHFHPAPPDAVAYALSTEEVSEIVKVCAAHELPIIAWGTGTSLEGNVQAIHGGVTIDLSGMDQVVEVNDVDGDCMVQAGVTRKAINEYLRDTGYFFPVDPGADASLGGMAATGASGTNAVRYGTMKENVIGLTVVLADGTIMKTGGRARKSSAGYDLTHLMVGSEGTLGIITEVRLRLYGVPEKIAAAVCQFDDLAGAVLTAQQTIQVGVPVARIELLDDVQMQACVEYSKLEGFEQKPTLFFEFHGTEAGVAEQAETVEALASDNGGAGFQWTMRAEERSKLWQARHDAYYACLAKSPGKRGWATDVVVPISRLAECIVDTQVDIGESKLYSPICGHVGDGNFHCCIMVDLDDAEEMGRATAFNDRLVGRALEMGGSCTGEHGIGMGKIESMGKEHGAPAIELMRTLKRSLDPKNILNPGKVVPI
ncbi:MAG: FAD-binding oxidoreductase [Alphaproteobacteria bacterium]